MLRSAELQSVSSQVRQELAVVITGLEEATFTTPNDYELLETHVLGALGILKTNYGRICDLDRALGDFPIERDAGRLESAYQQA